ncbi:MAG: ComF family protein [Erythrobacter sp.]|uniref:ComF family protein n=1 Tax=Erythrobacter sp. TaxID=1042 RepID=UPI0026112563|nr:ComF family protein [Erythrobacter sp.]MDJ0977681.1 ComF family protein [Erythrobacter sp.]
MRVNIVSDIKAGLRPIVDLIYPPRCPVCGVAIAAQGGLCVDCWSKLEASHALSCDEDNAISAPWIYNDTSRQLVLNLKHGGKIALAKLMAQMMATRLPNADPENPPLLVPVPLHRLRLLERGYNQAALLAGELAKAGKGEACLDALSRRKRTPSLGGLDKKQRRETLKGAIEVAGSMQAVVTERDVILVDDVYTSGATSSACIEALRDCQVRSVKTVCFAEVENT